MIFGRSKKEKEAQRQEILDQVRQLETDYWQDVRQGKMHSEDVQPLFDFLTKTQLRLTLGRDRYQLNQRWLDKIVKPICRMLVIPADSPISKKGIAAREKRPARTRELTCSH